MRQLLANAVDQREAASPAAVDDESTSSPECKRHISVEKSPFWKRTDQIYPSWVGEPGPGLYDHGDGCRRTCLATVP